MGRTREFTRQGACRAAMPGIASGAQRGRWARKAACRGDGKHDPMGTIR